MRRCILLLSFLSIVLGLTGYAQQPVVTTEAVTNIGTTTATGNGTITDLGSPNPTQYGVCWSTSTDPTIDNDKTEQGEATATGAFTSDITGLSANTIYYVRAYATNTGGTAYGEEVSFCTSPSVTAPSLGDGSSGNPYQIATWQDLYWLSQTSGVWGSSFIQTADITFPATINNWDYNQGWSPIGNASTKFSGTYNGGDYSISDLYINRPSTDYDGLFGYSNGGSISNLQLINVDITGNYYVGGIIGYNNSSIEKCSCSGTTSGQYYFGGIAGLSYGQISQCFTSGTLPGYYGGGGITGYTLGSIINCYSTCSVSGSGGMHGGISGAVNNGSIINCYSAGVVAGKGVVSYLGVTYTVSNSFWDTDVTPTSNAGTGLTTSEMKTISNFTLAGWDFASVWAMTSTLNGGYPCLLSQVESGTWSSPIVTTQAASNLAYNSATLNGTLTDLGEPQPFHAGFCWSTSTNPTISNDTTDNGGLSATGAFTADITALTAGVKYYVRAYATNNTGTVYGDEINFTTLIPTVTSATYDAGTGVLVLTCTNLTTGDDISPTKITVTGEGGLTYTLTTGNVTASSSTSVSITLSAPDKSEVNQIINKNETSSTSGTAYNIAVADDWDTNVTSGNSADVTNILTASNVAAPNITKAFYDAASGALAVVGAGFFKLSGETNDIDISKLTVTGESGATHALTTASVDISSDTTFFVSLNETDKTALYQLFNKNGTNSIDETTYNLAAAEDWATGADPTIDVADMTGNGITVSNLALPVVATEQVTSIDTTTATGNGDITDLGIPNPSQYGVCWSTTTGPTILDSKTEEGEATATGAYTSDITGLTPGTTYFVKAYATNTLGTVYGEEVSFKTYKLPAVTTQAVTDIDTTSATANGTITDLGNPNPTQHGFCWSILPNPSPDDNKTEEGASTLTGTYTSSLTGLTPGETYYIRAYAINTVDTVYGEEVNFTAHKLPVVTTQAVTDINITSATANGTITDLGVPNPSQHGFCWSTSTNPTPDDNKEDKGEATSTGAFISALSGLTSGETYYVRAYAINAVDTVYGKEVSFTTLHLPVVTTADISSITMTSAFTGGDVTDEGGTTVFEKGICWGTSPGLTILDDTIISGTGGGSFTIDLTGLTTGETYYVRAYATNIVGTSYGEEKSFTTYLFPGSGTEADPFQIVNLDNLTILQGNPGYWDKQFIQTNDIDASETSTWNGNTGWSPIGTSTTSFSGSYNGQGHVISNLFINRSANDQGLFGFTSGGTLQNLGLTNANITGGSNTGSLAGTCQSTVSQCYCSGTVAGDDNCGGLIGYGQYCLIINSYSKANVSGTLAGCLVGIGGVITNSYSNGLVSGSAYTGLVGQVGSVVNNSFYDADVCGITSLVQGKTTSEMKTMSTFSNAGWDFLSVWHIDESASNPDNDGYPSLAWQDLNQVSKPLVTTQSVTNITSTSATGNGSIADFGSYAPTQHGVCWSSSNNPTIDDYKTEEGAVSSTGAFTSEMTGLTIGQTYHARAYATNDLGTGYGNEVTFKMQYLPTVTTQAVSNITTTSATGNGTITNVGDPELTQHGVCWNTSGTPTIEDSKTEEGALTAVSLASTTYTNGDISTDYNLRALSQQSNCPGTMVVTIPANATITSVDVEYDMTAQNGGLISEQLSYLRCSSFNGESEAQLFAGTGDTEGTYHYSRTGLTIANNVTVGGNILFELNAGRTNGDTEGDSIISCDTTFYNCDLLTEICDTLITCDTTVIKCDPLYNKVDNETWKVTVHYSVTGNVFSSSMTGLEPYTSYHVRAYATNEAGTAYGDEVSFTTLPVLPTVTTQTVTDIEATTATGNGNIIDLGAPTPSQYGVCWNTTGDPTLSDDYTEEGNATTTGAFTTAITGLAANTTYYVKAYATNTAGTVYGDKVSFTTLSSVPTDLTVSDSTITSGSDACFDAVNEIIVACNSAIVILEDNSSSNFIAGQSVTFLPGFHAEAGSYVHAWITTDASFCDMVEPSSIIVANLEKGLIIEDEQLKDAVPFKELKVKTYPNPNSGQFKIEISGIEEVLYEIRVFNMIGKAVYYGKTDQTFTEINLDNAAKGLYILNVNTGKKNLSTKIVVQ